MATATANAPVKQKKRKKKSQVRAIFERIAVNKPAMAGLIVLGLLVLVAIFAPLIAPYSVTEQDFSYVLKGPNAQHIFGTDNLGRDIFSRCVYGARYSLALGLSASLFAAVVVLLVDLAYGMVDPRIKAQYVGYSKKSKKEAD